MPDVLVVASFAVVLVLPTVLWRRAQRWQARPGSFLARAAQLATIRVVTAGVVLGAHLLLALFLVFPPHGSEPPLPGHQYGPRVEAWQHQTTGVDLLCVLASVAAWVAVAVLCVRGAALARRAWRARALVLSRGTRADAAATEPESFDFGTGEERWIIRSGGGDGYRDAALPVAHARGTPSVQAVIAGPSADAVLLVALLVVAWTDVVVSIATTG